MRKIFSAVLTGLLAITVISCSDEQDDLDYTKNNKISVEMISAPNTTRGTSASVAEGEGLYRVSCQGKSYDVMMLSSTAQKLNSSSSKNGWRTKKIYGFTSMEDDRNGLKGGDTYKLSISSQKAKEYGLAPGVYFAKSVLFVNKCKLPANCEVTQGEVDENKMGYNPSNRKTRGFSITRSGTDVIVKTAGTWILYTSGGATVNKPIPVSKEKMEFDIAYLDIDEPISDPVGYIQTVSYTPGSKTVYVDYTLKFAQNPTIGIYDESGKKLLKSVKIANSSTTKCASIYDAVEPNKTYQAYICENGEKTSIYYTFDTNDIVDKIVSLKYDGRIMVDFTIKKTGDVGFKLISTRTGKTYDYYYGYCGQQHGTYNLTIPSDDNGGYHGSIIYVVMLTVDGKVVDNNQIAVSR